MTINPDMLACTINVGTPVNGVYEDVTINVPDFQEIENFIIDIDVPILNLQLFQNWNNEDLLDITIQNEIPEDHIMLTLPTLISMEENMEPIEFIDEGERLQFFGRL